MTKHHILGAILGLGLFGGTASADDKDDAQRKVDAARLENCEKVKTFLGEQEAKGRCKDESAEAKKITCSASTFQKMTDLNTRCMKAPPAKDDKAAGGTKCRAMIEGKQVAEVDDASSVKCAVKLMDAVRGVKCTTADMKGKKVAYTINHDHVVAKKPLKDRDTSLTCSSIKPAK